MGDMTLVEAVADHAEKYPDKVAVRFRTLEMTYKELYNATVKMAIVLKNKNVKTDEKVLLTAVSKPDYVVGLLAIQYVGACAVPIDKIAKENAIMFILKETNAKVFITDTQKIDNSELSIISYRQYKEVNNVEINYSVPDDEQIIEMLFTSGTTGRQKGGMLSSRAVKKNISNTINGVGMLQSDVILLPLPLNHSFGMRVLRSALYIGAEVVLQNGYSFVKETEDNLINYQCTGFVCVPITLKQTLDQFGDRASGILENLRYIEIGAGSLSVTLKNKLITMTRNTDLYNTWGSTETGGAIFLNFRKHPDKVASIGRPIDGISVRTVNNEGQVIDAIDAEHAGRMQLNGRSLMSGYYNQPDKTAETIQNGWLLTGDLVYHDSDGYFYMLGRADDIIKVGGENVSPIEIEEKAALSPDISECACIGVTDPDDSLGFMPVLYVVPFSAGQYSEEGIRSFLMERLERYKIPRKYIVLEELPRNRMGKLDRKALKKMYQDTGTTELMNQTMHNILARRSIRNFSEKKISEDILKMILKAGYSAPTGHNMQTWRFTVVTGKKRIDEIRNITEKVAVANKVYFYGFNHPSCLVLISNDNRNPDGCQDASCAAENIFLAAQSYGIGSVWLNPLMTLRNADGVKELLDAYEIPANHTIWCMAALGYPAEEGKKIMRNDKVVRYFCD